MRVLVLVRGMARKGLVLDRGWRGLRIWDWIWGFVFMGWDSRGTLFGYDAVFWVYFLGKVSGAWVGMGG